jgi:transposase InsO family protein
MKLNRISYNAVYRALGVSKQSIFEHLQRSNLRQELLNNLEVLLIQVRNDHPVMALRTIHRMLQVKGIGRDQFESYFKNLGFGIARTRNYRITTDSRGVTKFDDLRKDQKLTGINQLWVSDITYFEVGGRFYYITFILDVFSRRIIGYSASKTLQTIDTTLPALRMSLKCRRISKASPALGLIFHSDGGGQYYCKDFLNLLRRNKIGSSMAEVVYDNSHAERINGTIKNNYLIHRRIDSFEQLIKELDRSVKLYNYKKPHFSLTNQTPVAFENNHINFAMQQNPKVKNSSTEISRRKGH